MNLWKAMYASWLREQISLVVIYQNNKFARPSNMDEKSLQDTFDKWEEDIEKQKSNEK